MQSFEAKYPGIKLPKSGEKTREWALEALFGEDQQNVWVTQVRDPLDGAHWAGAHLRRPNVWADDCGHYFNTTLIAHSLKGAASRTDESSIAGAVIFFDDVGDKAQNANAKMDMGWMEAFAPEPTCVVETSQDNFQWQYAIRPACPIETYRRLVHGLKHHPQAYGGVVDVKGLGVRYGRLPSGINPRTDRGRFKTRLVRGSGRGYTVEELARAFGIDLSRDPTPDVSHFAPSRVDQCPIDELRALLLGKGAPLRNDGRHIDDMAGRETRGEFLKIIAWIVGASGHSDEGLEVACEWADSWTEGVQKPSNIAEVTFRSIHDPRGGASALRFQAKKLDPQGAARVWARFGIAPMTAEETEEALGKTTDPQADQKSVEELLARGTDRGVTDATPASAPAAGKTPDAPPFGGRAILPGFGRTELTILGGKTGAFKSMYALALMASVVFNRPDISGFTKKDLDWQGDCLYFANEDPASEVRLRLDALIHVHKIDKTLPQHELVIIEDMAMFVRDPRTKRIRLSVKALEAIVEHRARRDIAVVVVDTLAASIDGGSDETNAEFQAVAGLARKVAQTYNLCVVLVHHVKKTSSDKNAPVFGREDLDMLRGGSTLGNSARNALLLSKPNRDEIKAWGSATARNLTCVTMAKRAHGELLDEKWFRKVSAPVMIQDIRTPGILIPTSSVALALENGGRGPDVSKTEFIRKALKKLVREINRGEEIIVTSRGRGRPNTVQGVLGVKDAEAEDIISTLRDAGLIEIEEIQAGANGKSAVIVHVTSSGYEAVKGLENDPENDEIPQ
jgi:hypothetical protein